MQSWLRRERFIEHMEIICFHCYCSGFWKTCLEECNTQPQVWLYNFPKCVVFSSTRMNYFSTTVFGSCDALHSQGQRTHQRKHAFTENSNRFKNGMRTLKIVHGFSSNSIPAKFPRAGPQWQPKPPRKKPQNKTRTCYILTQAVLVGEYNTGSSFLFCTIVDW